MHQRPRKAQHRDCGDISYHKRAHHATCSPPTKAQPSLTRAACSFGPFRCSRARQRREHDEH
eukprot:1556218-Prymnesium_polylepis.1